MRYILKIVPALALLLFMTGQAHAANLIKDKILLKQAVEMAENSRYGRHGLRGSYYKVRTVQADVSSLRRSPQKSAILNALGVALEKLNDRYLSRAEKIYFLKDCISVASSHIDDLLFRGAHQSREERLEMSIEVVELAIEELHRQNVEMAMEVLRYSLQNLRQMRYQGRNVEEAIRLQRGVVHQLRRFDPRSRFGRGHYRYFRQQIRRLQMAIDCLEMELDGRGRRGRGGRGGNRGPWSSRGAA